MVKRYNSCLLPRPGDRRSGGFHLLHTDECAWRSVRVCQCVCVNWIDCLSRMAEWNCITKQPTHTWISANGIPRQKTERSHLICSSSIIGVHQQQRQRQRQRGSDCVSWSSVDGNNGIVMYHIRSTDIYHMYTYILVWARRAEIKSCKKMWLPA